MKFAAHLKCFLGFVVCFACLSTATAQERDIAALHYPPLIETRFNGPVRLVVLADDPHVADGFRARFVAAAEAHPEWCDGEGGDLCADDLRHPPESIPENSVTIVVVNGWAELDRFPIEQVERTEPRTEILNWLQENDNSYFKSKYASFSVATDPDHGGYHVVAINSQATAQGWLFSWSECIIGNLTETTLYIIKNCQDFPPSPAWSERPIFSIR